MTWHAVDAVDDAVGATRRFLFPFSVVRWTKLALLVLLMGGAGANVSVPPLPAGERAAERLDADGLAGVATDPFAGVSPSIVAGIVAATVALAIVFSVASLSLRLVFYDALRTNEVRLRGPFVRRLRQAAGLFAFSLGLGLLLGGPFALAAAASERSLVRVETLPPAAIAALVLCGAVLVVAVLAALRATYEFVVPVMVRRDDGVIAAWRRFWPTLRASWTGFLVYLVVHFFLALGVAIAETVVLLVVGGTVLVLAAVALVVAAGLLGGLAALTGTAAGIAATVAVALVAVTTLLVVLLPVRLLTRTYLVAYEVATLGGIDPDLALLAPAIDPTTEAVADGSTTDGP